MCFLLRADETRFSELLKGLRKGILKRRDEYPKTVMEAYKLLIWTSGRIGHVQRKGTCANVHYRQTYG